MALDRNILNKIQLPSNSRPSGASAGITAGSAFAKKVKEAIEVGANKSSGVSLVDQRKEVKNHDIYDLTGIKVDTLAANNVLPFQRKNRNQPVNQNQVEKNIEKYSASGFLNKIIGTHEDSKQNLFQGNSARDAIPVGQQLKPSQANSSKQDSVIAAVQNRQAEVQKTREQKQEILDSRNVPIAVGQGNITQANQEINQIGYQVNDTVAVGQSSVNVAETKTDEVELPIELLAKALYTYIPFVDAKDPCGTRYIDGKYTFVIKESPGYGYEFNVEVLDHLKESTSSEIKKVYQYFLEHIDEINSSNKFGFFINPKKGGVQKQATNLKLNFGRTSFGGDEKMLYFSFRLDVDKALFSDSIKDLVFFRYGKDGNVRDGFPIRQINVYYKKEKGVIYYSQKDYEDSLAGGSDQKTQSSAVAYEGELSKDEIVIADQKIKNEVQQIAEGIRSSELSDSNQPLGKAIAVGSSSNEQKPIPVGGKNKAQKVGGDHSGQSQGGKHEFHAHATPNFESKVDFTGVGGLANVSKIGSMAGKASVGGALATVGAAAVGSSGQGIRGVTGGAIQAYQSGGFQQQGSIGVSNFGYGFGGSQIRGISNLRSGHTIIAGENSDSVLFFAQPGQENIFADYQNPLAGVSALTVATLNPNGTLNSFQSPAARAALNSARGGSSGFGNNSLRKAVGKYSPTNRKFGSGLGSAGSGGGNGNGRKNIIGGFSDDDDFDPNSPDFDPANLTPEQYAKYIKNLTGDDLKNEVGEFNLDDQNREDYGDYILNDASKEEVFEELRKRAIDPKLQRINNYGNPKSKDSEDYRNLKKQVEESKYKNWRTNPIGKFRQSLDKIKDKKGISLKNRVYRAGIDAFGKKAAKELAKKFFVAFWTNPVTLIILASLLFGLILVATVLTSYCYPRDQLKTMRDALEPVALSIDALGGNKSNLEKAGDLANIGLTFTPSGIAGKIGYVLGGGSALPSSNFRKWIEAQPGCDGPENKCAQSGAGDAISGALGEANGKVSAAECTELLKYKPFIEEASRDYGIPVPIIAGVLSRETNVGLLFKNSNKCEGRGDTGGRGHGLSQVDQASGAFGKKYTETDKNGKLLFPDPAQFPVGTSLQDDNGNPIKDKSGKPLVWSDCRDNIMYLAFHLIEVKKACSKDLKAKGPEGSLEWWKALTNGYNRWCGGVKDESITANKNYGTDTLNRAADAAKCLGITNVTTTYLDTRQQDQTNKYWSEAFGFPVLAKVGEKIKNPVLTGLEVLDARILAFNKVMEGKISVEAFNTTGPVIDSNKDHIKSKELEDAINSGKLKIDLSTKENFIKDVQAGLSPSVVGFLLNIAIKYNLQLNALSTNTHRYNVDDDPTRNISPHSYGDAMDFQMGATDATNIVKAVKEAIAGGAKIKQWGADPDNKAALKAAGFPDGFSENPDGGGHIHIQLESGGVVSGNGSASGTDPCVCPDGSSTGGGAISTSTGPGTVSTGGIFTPEVRAFLDTIANWEAEGDKLGIGGYNSGNFKANLFDSTKYATSFPSIDSPGNGGRYQVRPVFDKKEADTFLGRAGISEKIVGFDAKNQDLFAVGRFYYRAIETNKENKKIQELLETNFERAAGIASAEWASAPVITGYQHADAKQSKADIAKYKSYYEQRLAIYKKTSSFDIFKIFGGVRASAADANGQKVADLFKSGEMKSQASGDAELFAQGKFDPKLSELLVKLVGAGFTITGGPRNLRPGAKTASGNDSQHGIGQAYDIAEIGKKGSASYNIKTYAGNTDYSSAQWKVMEEFTAAIKSSGLLKGKQLIGPSTAKSKGFVFLDTSDVKSNHEDHLHVGIDSSGTGKDIASSNCKPCETPATTPTKTVPINEDTGSEEDAFYNIFSTIKAIAAGSRPSSYSQITKEHLDFMAKIAEKRGYFKTTEAKQSELTSVGSIQLEKTAAEAFTKMQATAKAEGVNFTLNSGYRGLDEQTKLFFKSSGVEFPIPDSAIFDGTKGDESAYNARLNKSAVPGYSEHATGKAFDLDSDGVNVTESFRQTKAYDWLTKDNYANSKKFGFQESYPENSTSGANKEPWHWRFGPAQNGSNGSSTSADCPKTGSIKDLGANSTLANINPPKNFILTDENGKVIKQIDGGSAVEGASIFKVIVASVVLKKGIDINKQIVLDEKSWLPDEEKYTKNQSVPVSKLLFDMLNDSNNTAANALMNQFGGIGGGFDTVAKEMGYSSIAFGNYFRASARPVGDNPNGTRLASAVDVNSALIDIFKNAGGGLRHSKERIADQSSYI
jgi:LAS superfamily LD-carboxypeptidase LdcB